MSTALGLLAMFTILASLVFLVMLLFKSKRRFAKQALKITFPVFIFSLIAFVFTAGQSANSIAVAEGWNSSSEKQSAKEIGIDSPSEWKSHVAEIKLVEIEKQKKAAAEQKRKDERQEIARVETERLLKRPDNETKIVGAISDARDAYNSAKTDFQKGSVRPSRSKEICSLLESTKVDNWVGTVANVTTNSDGKGVVSIQIGRNAYVTTWNNALSDTFSKTMVEPGTEIYKTLGNLKDKQSVRFSGEFFRSDSDCIEEQSLTMSGSLTEPEFTFQFSDITPIQIPDPE